MSLATPLSETEILAEAMVPTEGDLAPEVVVLLLKWKFSKRAVQRMNAGTQARRRQTVFQ
ncbi:MAG TPA: hypothetical protein PLX97_06750 [Gemmatales bacterium]|nr:hypothetical protein [Gemmatales bacterium]